MDKLFQGLSFITTYLDDILVHSCDVTSHMEHLRIVFQRLLDAGLMLRGKKCHLGMSEVSYLGHIFSARGMAPDPNKVKEWPTLTSWWDVKSFISLASYYRRYILQFANTLHQLMQKNISFHWPLKT